jgi:sirohydrochlorin ferrochelatase
MSPESLLLVAHGSRDPRHEVTIRQIAAVARAARPDLDVRVGFLDHNGPRVAAALTGASQAIAVPLLLGNAYHGKVDVPAALTEASAATGVDVVLADVLGPDPELLPAALRAVRRAAGTDPGSGAGLVLACAGTTDASAKAALNRLALRWRRSIGADVRVADAANTGVRVADAVADLRAAGCARVDVAAWFLAPGLLLDRAAAEAVAAGADSVAAPLGAAPEVVATVLRRFDAVAAPAAQVA